MAKAKTYAGIGCLVFLFVGFGVLVDVVTGRSDLALLAGGGLAVGVVGVTAFVFLAFGLAIGIHELGHYVAGRAVGFRFQSFVAGPLGFRAEGDRIVHYRVRPARMLGFVIMTPDREEAIRRRYQLFILGGPVASLLWCGLLYGAWRLSGVPLMVDLPPRAGAGIVLASIGMSFLLLSALLILPNTLIPYRARTMGGVPTDMLWILLLRREGEASRRMLANLTLARLLYFGTPARDLPETLVEEGTRLRDGTFEELVAQSIRWMHGVHRNPKAANDAIARHAEIAESYGPKLIDPYRTSAHLVQALDAAFQRKDADTAERWMQGLNEPMPPTYAAAVAALRDAPNRADLLAFAERQVEESSQKTTLDYSDERAHLAALRKGWPNE